MVTFEKEFVEDGYEADDESEQGERNGKSARY